MHGHMNLKFQTLFSGGLRANVCRIFVSIPRYLVNFMVKYEWGVIG
jgi:hypothetical protein